LTVWRRNVLVWRKLITPSLLINFGEPLLYLLGLGYGLGLFIGDMAGLPYLTFLASGIVASSAMNTASRDDLVRHQEHHQRHCHPAGGIDSGRGGGVAGGGRHPGHVPNRPLFRRTGHCHDRDLEEL
jgi:hypothetical protein